MSSISSYIIYKVKPDFYLRIIAKFWVKNKRIAGKNYIVIWKFKKHNILKPSFNIISPYVFQNLFHTLAYAYTYVTT